MAVALQRDPVRLVEWLFNHDHWETPREIIRSVMRPHSKTAVAGCHSSSKTFTAADIILASLIEGGDVITTAPTDDQVRGILWHHVHEALKTSVIPLPEWGTVNQVSIQLPTGETAMGRSTNQGVRFQGYHAREGRFLLIVVDESPGVLPAVFGAISGIRAGGDVRLLVQGNPLEPVGPFYDIFQDPTWNHITIDAFDSPNLKGVTLEQLLAMPEHELDIAPRPYLATRRWVLEKYREVRGDLKSSEWLGRVRGQFPEYSLSTLLWRIWLDEAASRRVDAISTRPVCAGVDVAGPGEAETVLTLRRDNDILHMEGWAESDPRRAVIEALEPWIHQGLKHINVDSAGIGWYFYCDLRERFMRHGAQVHQINVGEASSIQDDRGNPKFANKKAEYYWSLRERFASGGVAGLASERAIKQLSRIQYTHDTRNRIAIETKEDALKRGEESPDWAESVMLAFADPGLEEMFGEAIGASSIGAKPRMTEAEKRLPWNKPATPQERRSWGERERRSVRRGLGR